MNLKKYLPHLIAIAAFIAVSMIYFSPLLDGKKQIQQSDISQFRGSAQEIEDFRKDHKGEEPIWTNSMFGGMPAYQISVYFHNNLMKYVDKAFQLGLPFPVGYVFLYFVGFFILMMCLRVNPWIALVVSLAYGFSSFFFIILEVGHNTQAHAIGYAAPMLGGVILTLRRKMILGMALTTLFAALEFYCNHVQITYYFFMAVLAIMAVEFYGAIREKRIPDFMKRGALVVVAILIAILPNITNLWTTYEYGKYTTRGTSDLTINANKQKDAANKTGGLDRDYATQWSYGIGETFTFLIPNFKGGVSEGLGNNKSALETIKDPQMRMYAGAAATSYFGEQYFTLGPVYIGAIMVFLAVLGLFLIGDRMKWALLIITVVSVMLSWGKNLMWFSNLFFDYFPGYNKFRSVSMILVIAELTIPVLAALALQRIIEAKGEDVEVGKRKVKLKRALFISAGITGGFALVCYLAPGAVNTFHGENDLQQITQRIQGQIPSFTQADAIQVLEQVEIARTAVFRSDAIRTVIFILLAMGTLWLFITKKINEQIVVVALVIFVLADMWPVAARYLSSKNYVNKTQASGPPPQSKADEFILADKSLDYRVLNYAGGDPFQDGSTSYWHKSIGGYHGAKLKRYKELIDFQLGTDIATFIQGLRTAGISDSSVRAAFSKTPAINMLNTKYIIIQPDAPPLVNPNANGNAWFVKDIVMVKTADDEILKLNDINTKETAIINEKYSSDIGGIKPQYEADATIKLNSYQANKLVYESNSKSPQLAVFSEIYYPKGWIATIDGKETPIVNADFVLRALVVPAGKHTIEFAFKPSSFYTGEKIALAGSFLVLIISFGGIFFAYKKGEFA
jgi:hypothetical protein